MRVNELYGEKWKQLGLVREPDERPKKLTLRVVRELNRIRKARQREQQKKSDLRFAMYGANGDMVEQLEASREHVSRLAAREIRRREK